MKLRHTIAGTLALPLALAVASANAATVFDDERGKLQVGGYIQGIFTETLYDKTAHDSDVNNDIGLGLSRLNLTYTNDAGVTLLYENDWAAAGTAAGQAGYRLRHAAVMYNGLVAGQTWSGFANLTGLGETIDNAGTSGSSTWANRTAVLGKNFDLNDDMSVGIFLEDQNIGSDYKGRANNTALPDITANFKGKFDIVDLFVGVRMNQVDDTASTKKETEAKLDFALGASAALTEELTLKAGFTMYDEGVKRSADGRDMAVSVAVGFKANDQLRFNAIVDQFMADADNRDSTSIWVNGFYTLDSGLELGGELQLVSADAADKASGLGDGDMAIRLAAKYAF